MPSSYFNNWQGYQGEGTRTQIQIPSSYDPNTPTPLVIAAHGYGSIAVDTLLDYGDGRRGEGLAAGRGRLPRRGQQRPIAASFDPDGNPYDIRLRVGLRDDGFACLAVGYQGYRAPTCRPTTTSIPRASTWWGTRWAA